MLKKKQLDDAFECIYCNDSSAQEELIALTDSRFSPIIGSNFDDLNLKITDFIVHDSNRLMCSLEERSIEDGQQIYVCGKVSSICDSNSTCVKMIGPLNEWWFSGFDRSSSLIVGIESPYSCYLLEDAHHSYQNIFEGLNLKMSLTKFVVEILQDDPDCNFETLLSLLKDKCPRFTSAFILSSIKFLINQIKSYDSCRDSDELELCQLPVFKIFEEISRSGGDLGDFRHLDRSIRKLDDRYSVIDNVHTEKSKQIFDLILNNILHNSDNVESLDRSNFKVNEHASVGTFVQFEIENHICYGRIISTNDRTSHVNLFKSGEETFLGETVAKNILFATKSCMDIDFSITPVESIVVRLENSFPEDEVQYKSDNLICFQLHDEELCFFQSLPLNYKSKIDDPICLGCPLRNFKEKESFSIGNCVLFPKEMAELPVFDYFSTETNSSFDNEIFDKEIFPEKYRKKHSDKDCYHINDLISGYSIGYIKEILYEDNQSYLILNVFYRPENIFEDFEDFIKCDINLLFWSENKLRINSCSIYRKCTVIYSESFTDSLLNKEFFYFNQCFNTNFKRFEPVSENLKTEFSQTIENLDLKPSLNILDLFSGCGGLSYGFNKLALKLYAIEKDKSAAQCFRNNFPDSKVYNADANSVLKMLIEKQDEFVAKQLPPLDRIDLIIGGPPCQGFSEMNRFHLSEYSFFKRSSIGTYLNFIEFYRPKYFLFENVHSMIHYGKSLIFKIVCSFFIHLGYQLRIAILQAGCYGLPQNRRRLFIIGARAGLSLPEMPRPTHIFAKSKSKTSFKIDEKVFDPFRKNDKGVFRMTTIQDAISDLIELDSNNYTLDNPKEYKAADSHYQRQLRSNCNNDLAMDHYCKMISQLNMERIKRIPRNPGSDWRDLPNIRIQLPTGLIIEKLEYSNSKRKNNRKQRNTLIPWCLVNTADKNNQWSGLYGRLLWRGFFPTIVTNPDPICSQGKVIHPDQNRIISIREMARSQGFPDDFRFFGSAKEKYSLIGNAVPPIISIRLAQEFAKSLSNSLK